MKLLLCSGCVRHVRSGEPACPFCGTSTKPSVAKVVGGLVVAAATVALTATSLGCAYGIAYYGDAGQGADANEDAR